MFSKESLTFHRWFLSIIVFQHNWQHSGATATNEKKWFSDAAVVQIRAINNRATKRRPIAALICSVALQFGSINVQRSSENVVCFEESTDLLHVCSGKPPKLISDCIAYTFQIRCNLLLAVVLQSNFQSYDKCRIDLTERRPYMVHSHGPVERPDAIAAGNGEHCICR